jgi:hypothetical protein
MGGGFNKLASLQFLLLLLYVNFMACVAEERAIYLVLVEGDPVAFHRGPPLGEDGRRLELNRFGLTIIYPNPISILEISVIFFC